MNYLMILDLLKEHYYVIVIIAPLVYFILNIRISSRREKIKDEKVIITNLISDIQRSAFNISFGRYEPNEDGSGTGSSTSHHINLFQINSLNKRFNYKEFEDCPVFFSKGSNIIFEFEKYLNNPTLPKRISNKILNFNSFHFDGRNFSQIKNNLDYVMIDSGIFEPTDFYRLDNDTHFKLGNAIAFQSYLSFKLCCANLETEIRKWSNNNSANLVFGDDFIDE